LKVEGAQENLAIVDGVYKDRISQGGLRWMNFAWKRVPRRAGQLAETGTAHLGANFGYLSNKISASHIFPFVHCNNYYAAMQLEGMRKEW